MEKGNPEQEAKLKRPISRFNRRMKGHDYRSRCIYMITMIKEDATPRLSAISRDEKKQKIEPVVRMLPCGEIVQEGLAELCSRFPMLKVLTRIVMPDHIHFELFVKERSELPLGAMIRHFSTFCTQRLRERFPEAAGTGGELHFFLRGFNDRVALRAGAKDNFYAYIADNPRRYLVKRCIPDYFRHIYVLELDGACYELYGNIFLLDNPVKASVKISRDPSRMPDLEQRKTAWEETMRQEGVLVSPFRNQHECEFRDRALEEGGAIWIINYTFSERTKPQGRFFDFCAEGKLLFLSTARHDTPPRTINYAESQELNALAARIAGMDPKNLSKRLCWKKGKML